MTYSELDYWELQGTQEEIKSHYNKLYTNKRLLNRNHHAFLECPSQIWDTEVIGMKFRQNKVFPNESAWISIERDVILGNANVINCNQSDYIIAGGPVKLLSWCPNNSDNHQILAILVSHGNNCGELNLNPKENNDSIQIWDFGISTNKLITPKLLHSFEHQWGSITSMLWISPDEPDIEAVQRSLSISNTNPGKLQPLYGHILFCCSDGFMRICPIPKFSYDQLKGDKRKFLQFNPEFILKLGLSHDYLNDCRAFFGYPTCASWNCFSPNWLIAGYSSGHIGVFDLTCVNLFHYDCVHNYLISVHKRRLSYYSILTIATSPSDWTIFNYTVDSDDCHQCNFMYKFTERTLPTVIIDSDSVIDTCLWPSRADIVVSVPIRRGRVDIMSLISHKTVSIPVLGIRSLVFIDKDNSVIVATESGSLDLISLNDHAVICHLMGSHPGPQKIDPPKTIRHYRMLNSEDSMGDTVQSLVDVVSEKDIVKLSGTGTTIRYPSINVMGVNPNLVSATWIAVGFDCGIVHLLKISDRRVQKIEEQCAVNLKLSQDHAEVVDRTEETLNKTKDRRKKTPIGHREEVYSKDSEKSIDRNSKDSNVNSSRNVKESMIIAPLCTDFRLVPYISDDDSNDDQNNIATTEPRNYRPTKLSDLESAVKTNQDSEMIEIKSNRVNQVDDEAVCTLSDIIEEDYVNSIADDIASSIEHFASIIKNITNVNKKEVSEEELVNNKSSRFIGKSIDVDQDIILKGTNVSVAEETKVCSSKSDDGPSKDDLDDLLNFDIMLPIIKETEKKSIENFGINMNASSEIDHLKEKETDGVSKVNLEDGHIKLVTEHDNIILKVPENIEEDLSAVKVVGESSEDVQPQIMNEIDNASLEESVKFKKVVVESVKETHNQITMEIDHCTLDKPRKQKEVAVESRKDGHAKTRKEIECATLDEPDKLKEIVVESRKDIHPKVRKEIDKATLDEPDKLKKVIVESSKDVHPQVRREIEYATLDEPDKQKEVVVESRKNVHPKVRKEIDKATLDERDKLKEVVVESRKDVHPKVRKEIDKTTLVERDKLKEVVMESRKNVHPQVRKEIEYATLDEPDKQKEVVVESSKNAHPKVRKEIDKATLDEPDKQKEVVVESRKDIHPKVRKEIDNATLDEPDKLKDVVVESRKNVHPQVRNVIDKATSDEPDKQEEVVVESSKVFHPKVRNVIDKATSDEPDKQKEVVVESRKNIHPKVRKEIDEATLDEPDKQKEVVVESRKDIHPQVKKEIGHTTLDEPDKQEEVVVDSSKEFHPKVRNVIDKATSDELDKQKEVVVESSKDVHSQIMKEIIHASLDEPDKLNKDSSEVKGVIESSKNMNTLIIKDDTARELKEPDKIDRYLSEAYAGAESSKDSRIQIIFDDSDLLVSYSDDYDSVSKESEKDVVDGGNKSSPVVGENRDKDEHMKPSSDNCARVSGNIFERINESILKKDTSQQMKTLNGAEELNDLHVLVKGSDRLNVKTVEDKLDLEDYLDPDDDAENVSESQTTVVELTKDVSVTEKDDEGNVEVLRENIGTELCKQGDVTEVNVNEINSVDVINERLPNTTLCVDKSEEMVALNEDKIQSCGDVESEIEKQINLVNKKMSRRRKRQLDTDNISDSESKKARTDFDILEGNVIPARINGGDVKGTNDSSSVPGEARLRTAIVSLERITEAEEVIDLNLTSQECGNNKRLVRGSRLVKDIDENKRKEATKVIEAEMMAIISSKNSLVPIKKRAVEKPETSPKSTKDNLEDTEMKMDAMIKIVEPETPSRRAKRSLTQTEPTVEGPSKKRKQEAGVCKDAGVSEVVTRMGDNEGEGEEEVEADLNSSRNAPSVDGSAKKGGRKSKNASKYWLTRKIAVEWVEGKFKGVQQVITGRLFDDEPVVGHICQVRWSKPTSQRKYPARVIEIIT